MNEKNTKLLLLILLVLLLQLLYSTSSAYPQEAKSDSTNGKENAVKVFVDNYWELDYLRKQVRFANYVRDPKQADIYILRTSQHTGSGGNEVTLTFTGQKQFSGMNDTLKHVSGQSDTDEMRRSGVAQIIKLGLMRYVAKTPLAKEVKISYKQNGKKIEAVNDKWDHWVFRTRFGANMNGEKSMKSTRLNGSFSANRITDKWKFTSNLYTRYNENIYETDEETIKSFSRRSYLRGLLVGSISDHWSAGAKTYIYTSTYDNTKMSYDFSPAIEYNIFPYSESTRKMFSFLYSVGLKKVDYREITIYDKISETLAYTSLDINLEVKEKWGSIYAELEGMVYINDLKKNKLDYFNGIDIRIFQGFSIDLWGGVSLIHDQLYLPKMDASLEEVLLERSQLETRYEYWFSFGLSYTFGSMYNNIVNPRLGGTH